MQIWLLEIYLEIKTGFVCNLINKDLMGKNILNIIIMLNKTYGNKF